ncbi:hypothetical protein GYB22_11225 [bacterium]|nr:hypothetical protein [bacterium]
MKKLLVPVLGLILFAACSDKSMEELNGIKYSFSNKACDEDSSRYWLTDFVLSKGDSVILNTKELKKKVEIDIQQIRFSSNLFQIMSKICDGDSANFKLPADSFYMAMKGATPASLKGSDILDLKVIVYDRLSPENYKNYKQQFEKERIREYIKKFGWNPVYDSATGIYYELLIENDNQDFEVAKFKYLIKDIQDQLISYSKDNEPLLYDKKDSSVRKGLAYLARMLAEGEKLRGIIPSDLAYGDEDKGRIRPYMPIVVELENVETVE